MNYYYSLQIKRAKRWMQEMGVPPLLGIVSLFLTVELILAQTTKIRDKGDRLKQLDLHDFYSTKSFVFNHAFIVS